MADRVLIISWGESVHGREERGLEVFNEAIGLYGRMQQDGRIESFDVVLCEPNGGTEGFMKLTGSADQLAKAMESDDFRDVLMDADLVVHKLKVMSGVTGEGLAREIARYQQAIAKVPQTA